MYKYFLHYSNMSWENNVTMQYNLIVLNKYQQRSVQCTRSYFYIFFVLWESHMHTDALAAAQLVCID